MLIWKWLRQIARSSCWSHDNKLKIIVKIVKERGGIWSNDAQLTWGESEKQIRKSINTTENQNLGKIWTWTTTIWSSRTILKKSESDMLSQPKTRCKDTCTSRNLKINLGQTFKLIWWPLLLPSPLVRMLTYFITCQLVRLSGIRSDHRCLSQSVC